MENENSKNSRWNSAVVSIYFSFILKGDIMIEQIPETNELFDAVRELEEYIVDLQSEIDYYSSEKSKA